MLLRACAIASAALGLAHADRPFIDHGETGVMGIFALPTSKFAGEEPGEGHARPGIGGGLDFLAHLSIPGIAWSSGLYFLWNPIEVAEVSSSVDLGSWVNIPLVTGARVSTPNLGGAARLFAQFQAGANLATQTDTKVPGGTIEVGWSTSLAFSFGVGAILLDRIHVGARYFHLGEPDYRVDDRGIFTGTQEPRVVALMIGAYFDTTN